MPQIATLACLILIVGLFALDYDRQARTSRALWIPVIWVSLVGSRMVSQWLGLDVEGSSTQILDGSPLDRNILTGILVAGVITLTQRSRQIGPLLRANWPVVLFFAYCGVSIGWSDYPDVAFKRYFKGIGDVVMVLIVLTDSQPVAAMKRFLARMAFVMLPLSVLFIKYYPDLGRGYGRFEGVMSVKGVATDKNMLGMLVLVLGMGTLWRFLEVFKIRRKQQQLKSLAVHGTMLAIVAWLLWSANSASSTSSLVLGGVVMTLTSLRMVSRRPRLMTFLVVSVVAAAYAAVFLDLGLTAAVGRDSTLTGRTEIWRTILSLAPNPFVGAGYQSFWLGERLEKIWSVYWFHPIEAHNGYIELYLNLGWVGLALFATLVVAGYRNILSAFRQRSEMAPLRLGYLVVALIYSFTEAALQMMCLVWIFFLVSEILVPRTAVVEELAEEMPLEETDAPLVGMYRSFDQTAFDEVAFDKTGHAE